MAKRLAMVKLRLMMALTAPKLLATAPRLLPMAPRLLATAQLDTVRSRLMAALMALRPLLAMARSKHTALLTAPRLQVTELLATAPKPLPMALDMELLLPDMALLLATELKLLAMEPPLLVMARQQAMEPQLAMELPGMENPTSPLLQLTAPLLKLMALPVTVPLATELPAMVPLATVPPVTVLLATVLLATAPQVTVPPVTELLATVNKQLLQLMAQATEALAMEQNLMATSAMDQQVTDQQVTDLPLATVQPLATDQLLVTVQPPAMEPRLAMDQPLVTDLLAMVPLAMVQLDTDLDTEATTAHGEYQVLATVQM